MSFKTNMMVDTSLVRKARLFAKLNGFQHTDTIAELALMQFLATDPRIEEADSVLEAAKSKAWRELEEKWAKTEPNIL